MQGLLQCPVKNFEVLAAVYFYAGYISYKLKRKKKATKRGIESACNMSYQKDLLHFVYIKTRHRKLIGCYCNIGSPEINWVINLIKRTAKNF